MYYPRLSKLQLIMHRFRLEWVKSFHILDSDEECSECHLEIVCWLDKVPRTRDIIKIFGKKFFLALPIRKVTALLFFNDSL